MAMGVLLAMPFGPVNLLGIQRAVERGFLGGMAAGLGIMAGDGLIALGAALGVNAISVRSASIARPSRSSAGSRSWERASSST